MNPLTSGGPFKKMKGNVMKNRDNSGYPDNTKNQIRKFGYNMIVLAISIGLYYLGFFGTAEGPLNPSGIGQKLKSAGFNGHHLLFALSVLFIISLTWNWIYNSVLRLHLYLENPKGENNPKPVKKGKWGHTVCGALLILILTFAFHMYKN